MKSNLYLSKIQEHSNTYAHSHILTVQIKRSLTNNSSSLSSMDLSASGLLSSLLLLYMTTNPFKQADNRRLLQECSSSEFSSILDMASATVQLQEDIYSFFNVVTYFLYMLKMSCCQSIK